MFQSIRYSQMALRIGLAIVFFWFGLDKFINPGHWVDVWMPSFIQHFVTSVGASPQDFIFLGGLLEMLVAVSLMTGFFMRWFSIATVAFLVVALGLYGLQDSTVYSIALIGALVSLIIWPERTYI